MFPSLLTLQLSPALGVPFRIYLNLLVENGVLGWMADIGRHPQAMLCGF